MRELDAYDQDFGTKSKEDQNWPLSLAWTVLTLRGYLKEGSSGDGQGQRFVNSLSQVDTEEDVNGLESVSPKTVVLALGREYSRKKLDEPQQVNKQVNNLESIVCVREWYRWTYARRWADVSKEV